MMQRCPNLLELWADAEKMCAFLGVNELVLRGEYLACNPYTYRGYGFNERRIATKDDPAFQRMTLAELLKWWMDRLRPEPRIISDYGRFMQECFSKALGIKRGTIEERRKQAIELRPDLYAPPDPEVIDMLNKYKR